MAGAAVQNLEDYTGKKGDDALHDPEAYFLWPLRPTNDSLQRRGVLHPAGAAPTSSLVLEMAWLPPALPRRTALDGFLQRAVKAFSLLGAFGTRSTRGYGQCSGRCVRTLRRLPHLPTSWSSFPIRFRCGYWRLQLGQDARRLLRPPDGFDDFGVEPVGLEKPRRIGGGTTTMSLAIFI